MLVREALLEHGIRAELIVMSDGEKAIDFIDMVDAAAAVCPDLIILDLNLPKRTGREVLERMRASRVCSHVPILVLSSSDRQQDKDEMARLGATRYHRKPARLEDFIELGGVFKKLLETVL